MSVSYVFADEAGDFTFKRKTGASSYFILCTLTTAECHLSEELLSIRRRLASNGEAHREKLHCTSDLQAIRDEVFALLAASDFRLDATLLEKSKAQPQTRKTDAMFYNYAWFYHFKHVGPILFKDCDKLLITASALGSKRTKAAFKEGVNNTVQQIAPRDNWEVAFMESSKDPYLWAADYCAWAIQRKWESGGEDTRSHVLIADKIETEYDLWSQGKTHYY